MRALVTGAGGFVGRYLTDHLAAEGDEVVGHVFFSPVRIEGEGTGSRAIALAPLAVLPERQHLGIGSRLVEAGLRACHALGEDVVFVLGHPGYYPRFGFRSAAPLGFKYGNAELDRYFMVAELSPRALAGMSGSVRYHPEFDRF